MQPVLNFFKYTVYTLLAICASAYIAFDVYSNYFYKKAIPPHIEITSIERKKSQGLIREACGVVIFKISKETIARVEADGLAFLDQDLHGRGYKQDSARQRTYYTYTAWKKTPVEQKNGLSPGFDCLLRGDQALQRAVYQAFMREGSFVASKPEAQLLLVPELGLLFFAYLG